MLRKRHEARFWQWAFISSVLLFSGITLYQAIKPAPRDDILVMTEEGYHIAKLQAFADADRLHRDQAELAALFLFQRSPKGFDYPERIKLLYADVPYRKAHELVESEREEFILKSTHQKVELFRTKILSVRDQTVLVSLTGQLIRTGIFENEHFVEAFKFEAKMTFMRNPDLIANGAYPTIVSDFEITTTPITKN